MQPPPLACQVCNKPAEVGYAAQLCFVCRTTLSKRPFPLWIKIAIILVGIGFLYALAEMPAFLVASIAFERGQRAEAGGNFETAASEYAKAVEKFPGSTSAVARLGIAQYRAGNRDAAVRTLRSLAGRQAPKKLTNEINVVLAEMQRRDPGAAPARSNYTSSGNFGPTNALPLDSDTSNTDPKAVSTWQQYRSPSGDFTVLAPGRFSEKLSGTPSAPEYSYECKSPVGSFVVKRSDFSKEQQALLPDFSSRAFGADREIFFSQVKESQIPLVGQQVKERSVGEGREIRISASGGEIVHRAYLFHGRFYSITAVVSASNPNMDADASRFLDSFRVADQ